MEGPYEMGMSTINAFLHDPVVWIIAVGLPGVIGFVSLMFFGPILIRNEAVRRTVVIALVPAILGVSSLGITVYEAATSRWAAVAIFASTTAAYLALAMVLLDLTNRRETKPRQTMVAKGDDLPPEIEEILDIASRYTKRTGHFHSLDGRAVTISLIPEPTAPTEVRRPGASPVQERVDDLVRKAWKWGYDRCVDSLPTMAEEGDSHNESQREEVAKAGADLVALVEGGHDGK